VRRRCLKLTDCIIVGSVARFESVRVQCFAAPAPAAFQEVVGDSGPVRAWAVVAIPVIKFLRIHFNFISGLLEMRCLRIEHEAIHKPSPSSARVQRKLAQLRSTMRISSALLRYAYYLPHQAPRFAHAA
jgi:hypothetical protein